jgi:hypothetical protein
MRNSVRLKKYTFLKRGLPDDGPSFFLAAATARAAENGTDEEDDSAAVEMVTEDGDLDMLIGGMCLGKLLL